MKHCSITQTAITVPSGCSEQRPDLVHRQSIDEPYLGALARQGMDAQHLIEASRDLVLDVSEEGSNRCETGVARGYTVLPTCLYMIQESQDKIGIKIFDLEIDRPASSLFSDESDQE
jgi:hypothetical protein